MAVLQAEVLQLLQAPADGGRPRITDPLTASNVQVGQSGCGGPRAQAANAHVRHPLAAVQAEHLQGTHMTNYKSKLNRKQIYKKKWSLVKYARRL